jgi:hypothetical protein
MQQLGESPHVQRRGLAVPGEQTVRAQRAEHLVDIGVGQGRDANRHVAEHLNHRAAEAGEHKRAEGRVMGHPDYHLHAIAYLVLDEECRGLPGEAGLG